jgi:hypothetical protein
VNSPLGCLLVQLGTESSLQPTLAFISQFVFIFSQYSNSFHSAIILLSSNFKIIFLIFFFLLLFISFSFFLLFLFVFILLSYFFPFLIFILNLSFHFYFILFTFILNYIIFLFIILNLTLQFGNLILSDNLTNSAITQPSRECYVLLGLVIQLGDSLDSLLLVLFPTWITTLTSYQLGC